jgi:hypothetical protein
MMKQSATLLVAVSLCFVAGCNRSTGNNAAANKATTNTVAPAANASVNAAAPAPAPTQVALALTPGGLEAREAGGRTSPLAFGTPAAQAVQGLTAMFGPTRIVVWSNGLRILAQNDQFQGWEINRPGIYALGDLQVGMTRAQLEANQSSFEQTTLGTEWTVGDGDVTVSGLLGENGNVSAMWAGLTCHMT